MAETSPKLKIDRRLLYMALPAILVPTIFFLFISKGPDLGQAEREQKAEQAEVAERERRLSARVQNPEAEVAEEARRAQEAVERERSELPPPPSGAGFVPPASAGADRIQDYSDEVRRRELERAREAISVTLEDSERQSALPGAKDERRSFVAYTAPPKEGLVSGTVGAAADAVKIEKKEEEKPRKPFLSDHNDKVETESASVAKRYDGLYWLAPGTVVRAVLLNAVDTRIPGQVTARVTETVYDSRYGRYPVIPAGSTLLGQYDSAIAHGQYRVMMSFSSLVTPSGGVVDLSGVRASDALGRLGIPGELHTYFWRRMGLATLFALESVAMDRLAKRNTKVSAAGGTEETTNTSEAARIISEAAKEEPWLKPITPNITIEEGQKISIVTISAIEIPPVANKR